MTRPRSATERLVDATATRLFHLPPQRGSYTVTPDIPVRMRDGARLLTDHYAPVGPALGTVLLRSPYQRAGIGPQLVIGLYASRGYHVVQQSCRGTFGSDGRFVPGENEVEDGADTVAWLREQPWFAGRFAAVGASYLSYTLWALLTDPPPELAAAVASVSFHDLGGAVHATGAFTLNDSLDWFDLLARQEVSGPLRQLVEGPTTSRRLARAYAGLPVAAGAEQHVRSDAGWYRDWATRTDPLEAYWQRRDFSAALDRVDVPVKLISGWQDLFLGQTLAEFARLRERGVETSMTIGPWTHAQLLAQGGSRVLPEMLGWVDRHLGRPGLASPTAPPVEYLVTGADQWRVAADWPPPATDRTLYLAPYGRLADEAPPDTAAAVTFTYDPADPTPTVGGRLLASNAGYREDSGLARRRDTLVFTSPPLDAALDVVGVPRVSLTHHSDPAGGDLWVRVSEVRPDGRSTNVTETFRASPEAGPDGPTTLDLDPVAHRFAAGSRIGLLVAGGSFPRYARNLGLRGSRTEGSATATTRQRITLASGGSWIALPTPRGSGPAEVAQDRRGHGSEQDHHDERRPQEQGHDGHAERGGPGVQGQALTA